jgi:hypothetical protein
MPCRVKESGAQIPAYTTRGSLWLHAIVEKPEIDAGGGSPAATGAKVRPLSALTYTPPNSRIANAESALPGRHATSVQFPAGPTKPHVSPSSSERIRPPVPAARKTPVTGLGSIARYPLTGA